MWPDDSGSWDPGLWPDDTGTTANNGPNVVSNDVLTGSTDSQGQDRWTGWFQQLVGGIAQYAVAKDAAQSGLTPTRAANGQPVYTATNPTARPAGTVSLGTVALVAGALGFGLLLSRAG